MALTATSFINNSASSVTNKRTGVSYLSSGAISRLNAQYQQSYQDSLNIETQNNGGFLGGVGYLFEKVGLGFLSGIEGIWDYGAGGIAKLFGADDWAEQQFSNDWVNYSHADEWFNPSEGWQVAGDVAGGIGTSLPAIAGVAAGAAIAYFSGGSLSPLAAGIISGSIAGFGAAGNATKEAYKQSGELGAKEFGYGFLSGATEAGVEILTAGMAKGSGRIVSSIAKATAKETAETVAKTGAKTVIKNLVTDFATEAFEEGLAEVLDPVYQRMTFNPDAENATPQEVAYAALVGGLSGLVMSGGSTAISAGVNTTQNLFSGSKAIENGTVESVMETARQLTETENANDTGYASFQTVKNAYEQLSESLKTTGGTVQTVKQKMLLGQIKRANTASIFMPFIERSAINILANAESVAQRYSEFGMKDANGKPLTLTADDIRSGVDATLLQTAPQERTKEQQKTLVKSIRTALTSNSTLATLAVADATGRITMDTQRFAEAALNGANLANSADLNYFVEHASKEQIAALSADLGISDWSAITIDDFRAKVSEFATSEKISEYAQQSKRIRAAMQTAQESAKPLPHILRRNMSDGVYRFTSENSAVNMAVFKEGETYHLFDYESGNISRSLSVQEVNKVLRTFWNSNTVQTPTVEQFNEETNLGRQALDIDAMATAQIPEYVTFSSEQVKNVDNKNPTTDRDIRHALPDEDLDALFDDDADGSNSAQDATFDAEAVVARGMPRTAGKSSLTVGELRKIIANNTKQKVYSKQDALSVVGRFAGISDLTQKTRTEIADAVWQILNESPDVEYRRDVAHDMAEFIVAKIIVDAKTENPDALEAQERLSYLRTGIGKLSFSEEDMSEIRHVRDKKGLKQVLGRWGYKGAHKVAGASGVVSSKRTPMDVFVVDIAREMPAMEYLEEMHPVDAFLEIDSLYERALAESKDKWISAYWDMPDSEIPSMIKSVEDEIMRAYETEGEQSKFSRMVENKIGYYSERAEYWKAEYDKIKGRDRLLGLLMSKAQKMKDLKLGTFANSTQHDSEIFKNSIEQLARIQFRGNLNVSGTRKILADLRQWYTSDAVKTGILEYVDANSTGLYVQGVADMLETLSEGKKGFTKDDLKMLYDVMSYFTNFVENWGKVFRQGRWIEAKPEAERYIGTLHANESLKVGLFSKLAGTTYMQTFGDPMTVARRMDMYESGFYTEMMAELRDAAVDAQVAEMEMRSAYEEFTKKHKKYVEKASVDTVTYRGTEIPKMHLIGLYMTMKRKHAWAGLAANGFTFTDTKGKRVRVNGVVSPEAKITAAELDQLTKDQLSAIEAILTDTDKEYIAILEQAYNVDARKLKADRDMQRLGFTNATNDYYYPIRRGNIAKNVDTADIAGELDRVSNSSFNKDTVRGAKQELFIESADAVFNRHIHAVCQYAYLSPAVEAYNRLYNLDISGNKNKPISVATESANTWAKGNTYFVKLISDIQGIPASSSEGMKALGFIRGSYAKFQLGANPKVWLTQLSSIFASSSLLDADSITRGMAISAKGMDQYCSLAKLRNNDNTAAMAQGVLDSRAKRAVGAVSKFSDLLMSPIGKMDRFVVGRLFGACQVQIEKNGGAKIGTEANKVEAGKLLRRVILETQQNAVATERSAAMRSGNEIWRTLTMFTSDSMKVVGRVIDAIGEVSTLKSKLKVATDADTRAALNQQLKAANRKARKAVGALCLTAVFMASIAQLFRWLYDKEQDEDETVAETMLVDAVGNLFGGLPIFKDVYSKIFEGYDVDNYAYSAVNDLLDSALNLFNISGSILTGEGSTAERNRAVRNLAYSVGQMFGIPVRNVYNVFFGLTKRFNPEAAYMIDSALYEKNYQNELYKAIEQDDAEMTSFIMSLLLGERMNENVDEAVFNELLKLSKNGQKVIPRSVPSSITIDKVEYPLSAAEQAAIKDIYATSEKSLKALFAKSKYNTLSDEQKAAAIDFIYDTYYDKALEGALGIDRGNNSLIIADVVGVDNLALLYVTTKGLTSDIDRRGNVISGSKRKKVVAAINSLGVSTEKKLLLICAKGYSLQDNDIRGLSAEKAKKYLLRYILSLKGKTKAEKAEIAELCGFEVVNGRIITKNL